MGAKETYLNAGFDDYMSKPIDIKGLGEMLKRYLET
jgi:CheY-like chemotaxis protein